MIEHFSVFDLRFYVDVLLSPGTKIGSKISVVRVLERYPSIYLTEIRPNLVYTKVKILWCESYQNWDFPYIYKSRENDIPVLRENWRIIIPDNVILSDEWRIHK